jgi:hypothetical protein
MESLYAKVADAAANVVARLGPYFSDGVYVRSIATHLGKDFLVEYDVSLPVKFNNEVVGVVKGDIIINKKFLVCIKAGKSATNFIDVEHRMRAIAKQCNLEGGILIYVVSDEEQGTNMKISNFEISIEECVRELDVQDKKESEFEDGDVDSIISEIKDIAKETADYVGEGMDASIYTKILLRNLYKKKNVLIEYNKPVCVSHMHDRDIAGIETIDIVINKKLALVVKALKTYPPLKDKVREVYSYCDRVGITTVLGVNFNHGSNAVSPVSFAMLP